MRDLRATGRFQDFHADVMVARGAEHTLELSIQAAVEVAKLIVADYRLRRATNPNRRYSPSNQRSFELLGGIGWIKPRMVDDLKRLVQFRNQLAHRVPNDFMAYDTSPSRYEQRVRKIVTAIVEGTCNGANLEVLIAFAAVIRSRISGA